MEKYKKLVGRHLIYLGYDGIQALELVVFYIEFIKLEHDSFKIPALTAKRIHVLYHQACAREYANK